MRSYTGEVERTIGYIVEDKAHSHGERIFMFYKDTKISYRQLHEGSNRVANALREMGVRYGDKVVTILPNFPEYLYIWWGIVKLGALNVAINSNFRGTGLIDVINRCDAKLAFVHEGLLLDRVRDIQTDLDQIEQVVITHSLDAPTAVQDHDLRFKAWYLRDLMTASLESPGIEVFNYTPSSIDYTSGTTGPPKGAVLSHEYFIYFAEHKAMHMETGFHDVIYNCFPMFNLTGKVETCLTAFISDAQFVLADHFNPKTFWDDIRKYNCTEFVSMGGVFQLVEKEPLKSDDADNPLKKIYILPCQEDFEKRVKKRFAIDHLVELYGQTESGISAYRDLKNSLAGCAGKAHCDYVIKIFDELDNEVPPNTEGEIVIRPLKPHIIMEEYYKMPDKTAAAMRSGWWHTGDIGKMDQDGNLFFVRRMTESVRTRGYFVSTTDVEEAINSHLNVMESAVYGVEYAPGEEKEVMAAIRLRETGSATPEDILKHIEKNVPYYAVPRFIRFVDEFPKSATMKIIKVKLQEEGAFPGVWDRKKAGYKLSKK